MVILYRIVRRFAHTQMVTGDTNRNSGCEGTRFWRKHGAVESPVARRWRRPVSGNASAENTSVLAGRISYIWATTMGRQRLQLGGGNGAAGGGGSFVIYDGANFVRLIKKSPIKLVLDLVSKHACL